MGTMLMWVTRSCSAMPRISAKSKRLTMTPLPPAQWCTRMGHQAVWKMGSTCRVASPGSKRLGRPIPRAAVM